MTAKQKEGASRLPVACAATDFDDVRYLKTIRKSNRLARARLKLDNVVAARIFAALASCVRSDDEDFSEYVIPVSVIEEDTGGRAYARIREALRFLNDCKVEIAWTNSNGGRSFSIYSLVAKATYDDGYIRALIHPDLRGDFIKLATKFTQFSFDDFIRLTSTYSQRLFEILGSYVKTHDSITIPLEELHRMLDVSESIAKRYPDFRRRVLEQAHKEICKKTGMDFVWNPIKKGRCVTHICFKFTNKTKSTVGVASDDSEKNISLSTTPDEQPISGAIESKAKECLDKHGGKCEGDASLKKSSPLQWIVCRACLSKRGLSVE